MIEIVFGMDAISLRVSRAELYILPKHVEALKKTQTPEEFKEYFCKQALINRPARKLFDAWMRKDVKFWDRFIPAVRKQFT